MNGSLGPVVLDERADTAGSTADRAHREAAGLPMFKRLLPKEHGAYGQMAIPLVTALGVSRLEPSSILLVAATVWAFLAHEPLLILLGRRGSRARRETGRAAAVWLAVALGGTVVTAVGGVLLMPSDTRWSLALPLAPAGALAGAIATGREKTTLAEIAVALSFSAAAVPVCLAAGAPVAVATVVAAVFAAVFGGQTLAVRGVIVRVRGGGDPQVAGRLQAGAVGFACGMLLLLAVMGAEDHLSWGVLAAAAPGLVAALWVALKPPAPNQLRTVGWTFAVTATLAAPMLIAALRGS